MTKNATIFAVCCKLHNFIIDNEQTLHIPLPSQASIGHHTEPKDRKLYLQDDFDLSKALHPRSLDLESSQLREDFTAEIEGSASRRLYI